MKRLGTLFCSLILSSVLLAQGSWKVRFGGRAVVLTSTQDYTKKDVSTRTSDLKNKQARPVTSREAEKQNGWERTMTAYGSRDAELKKQKGNQFQLTGTALQSLFKKSDTLKVYTMALPTDPKLKAAVRIRRVHLCTLIAE